MNLAAIVFLLGAVVMIGATLFIAASGDMAIATVCAALSVACPVAAMASYAPVASSQAMLAFVAAATISVLFFGTCLAGYALQENRTVVHLLDNTTELEAIPADEPVMVNVTALAPVSHRRSRRRHNRRLHLPVIHIRGRRSEHAHA